MNRDFYVELNSIREKISYQQALEPHEARFLLDAYEAQVNCTVQLEIDIRFLQDRIDGENGRDD
jgi:hypothetical protein